MRDKRLIVISVAVAIALFLIEANLGLLLNLVSADLDQWYSQNRNLVLGLTMVLVIVGATLVAVNTRLSFIKETETMPVSESANSVDATMVLRVIHEEFRTAPGEKIHFESIRQKLGLSEQELVYLVKKLEERGFVKATWIGRKALLTITEDGVSLLRDN